MVGVTREVENFQQKERASGECHESEKVGNHKKNVILFFFGWKELNKPPPAKDNIGGY